ncbi:MAG: restriction endonuclease subunit S [Candidatus Cloacimonetes bacterium]|nr:restriction endonuclease subunit S [Candidatus Cloacimonadota bacterium]
MGLDSVAMDIMPLGSIGTFIRGNGIQKKDFTDSGVGCIHYGQIHTFYGTFALETKTFVSAEHAKKLRKAKKGDLVIATTSEDVDGVCKAVAWLGNEDIAISSDAYIFRHNQNPKYISYLFQTRMFHEHKKRYATGTKVIRVSGANIAKFQAPIPPLPVQEEIVSILDKFTKLEAELEAELEARKKQYDYYRNQLLSPIEIGDKWYINEKEIEWRTLGDVGKICMCKRVMKNQTNIEGGIPFYKIGTFGKDADAFISEDLYLDYKSRYSFPNRGEVLISAAGTIGRAVIYNGEPAYFQDSNIVWIQNDESIVKNKYLFYYYQIVNWKTDGGTISRLYNDNLAKTKIPIPPLEEQERIVAILDKFDALVNDISIGLPAELTFRRQQYEYYLNKLLTFKNKDNGKGV